MEDWEVVRRTDLYNAVWKTLLDMAVTAEEGSITPGTFARVALDTCLTDAVDVGIRMTESDRSDLHAQLQKTLKGIVDSAYGAITPQTFSRVAVDVVLHVLLQADVITPRYTSLESQLVEAKADALTAHLRRKGLLP